MVFVHLLRTDCAPRSLCSVVAADYGPLALATSLRVLWIGLSSSSGGEKVCAATISHAHSAPFRTATTSDCVLAILRSANLESAKSRSDLDQFRGSPEVPCGPLSLPAACHVAPRPRGSSLYHRGSRSIRGAPFRSRSRLHARRCLLQAAGRLRAVSEGS